MEHVFVWEGEDSLIFHHGLSLDANQITETLHCFRRRNTKFTSKLFFFVFNLTNQLRR